MKLGLRFFKAFLVFALTFLIVVDFSFVVFLYKSEVSSAEDKPRYGGTFVVAAGKDPITLNLATTSDFWSKLMGAVFQDVLIKLDFDLIPVPNLARSWTISSDGLTYTFNLQETRWHDGRPLSSEDVKFTFEQIIMPYNPRGVLFKELIKEILTPNARTVIIKLKKPFEPFLILVAYDGFIQPKHLYEGTDIPKNPAALKPIGTGPFKFVEWKKGQYVRGVKNNDYYIKGRPYLDEIIFKVVGDPAARMIAFEKGEIDYISFYGFPPSDVKRISETPGFKVSSKGHEVFCDNLELIFNLDRTVMNNLKVRHAIAHAIDKQYIEDKADYGLGKVATGPITSRYKWVYTDDVAKYKHDLGMANKLLDEAGYPRDKNGVRFKISVIWDRSVPIFTKTAEILRQQLQPVGIDLVLNPADKPTAMDTVYIKRDFDLHIAAKSQGGDPAIGVERTYHSSNIRRVHFSNPAAYRSAKADEMLLKGGAALTREERAKYYREFQKIICHDLPLISLVEIGLNSCWRDEFRGLHEWSSMSFYTLVDAWWTKGRDKP